MWILLLALACNFSASTDVDSGDPADGGSGDGGGDGGGGQDSGADGGDGSDLHPSERDDDGDGYSENQGDCDDADASVAPGVVDDCNGVDDNCDGAVDDAARDEDPYEPNDDQAYDLGSLSDQAEHSLSGTLHNDQDLDRFSFEFEDTWNPWDQVSISLGSIPDGAAYRLVVENISTGEEYFSDFGEDTVTADWSDELFTDQSGVWEVSVDAMGGADCSRRYLLSVVLQ